MWLQQRACGARVVLGPQGMRAVSSHVVSCALGQTPVHVIHGGNFARGLFRRGKSRRGKTSPPLQIRKLTLPRAHTARPKPPDFAGGKFRRLP